MALSYFDIQSRDNNKIKYLRSLCEQASTRKKNQQSVLEGVHLIDAYLKLYNNVDSFFVTQKALENFEVQQLLNRFNDFETNDSESTNFGNTDSEQTDSEQTDSEISHVQTQHTNVYVLTENLYRDLRTLGPGIDIMAVISTPTQAADIDLHCDSLLLDNLQDPGNVGTLLRTAAAAGIKQIICSVGTAAIWSPRVLRAGMGAQFSLVIYEHVDLENLLPTLTMPIYATSSHATQSLYQLVLNQPCAWLLGNEGQGVRDTLMQYTQAIGIPQPGGQESLNVAVAGAVCMYEMVRQRLD